ncbi:ATP-binding protein [Leptolyngbya sp. FACHB-321]|uniref:AAA family ATPase n=1 Tax=Leptolyngbya sp. FACHB-321 TaxID=2692807 RepID=UPI001682C772|nr:ATP-binding protein [Leptolyngbya sp. FACHB-321]MBD2037648.1 ATP-binding protein [Leptolyngbya sp. FACHB-321]
MANQGQDEVAQFRTILLAALRQLDFLLIEASSKAESLYGSEAAANPYRGLYINREDIDLLLARKIGEPTLRLDRSSAQVCSQQPKAELGEQLSHLAPFNWLAQTFRLTPFDLSVLLLTIAPEIDLRYERIYAYLQDDVTRKHPSIDLALNLLCPTVEAKMQQRDRFMDAAPMLRHGLLQLLTDSQQAQPSFLSQSLKLDEQVIRFLLGQQGLDSRLAPFCQLIQPALSLDELSLNNPMKQALRSIATMGQPLQLYFQGTLMQEKRQTAEALCHTLGAALLIVELQAIDINTNLEQTVDRLCREAQFQTAVLYLDYRDTVPDSARSRVIEQALAASRYTVSVILADASSGSLSGYTTRFMPISFPLMDFGQRRAYWNRQLATLSIDVVDQDLDALADRFRLTAEQIADAVRMAQQHACWRSAVAVDFSTNSQPTLDELFMAARAQSSQILEGLTRKITPRYTWTDIVLPADQLARLKEICNHIRYRHVVYNAWGFDRKLSLGKGLNTLFSGPPGTGKTMAAEIIAHELRLDLYQIDLSQIVSKYIGETEKNLNQIFTAAESANAILLFDEADSLFGKRSDIKDAHDRYANIEVAYLLQKMEEYEGITILTTNLAQNLDEAFTRRLRFIIEFPFPDVEHRLHIWKGIFPAEAPIAPLDFEAIAQQFKLAGGNIRNIALAAAFLAAESGQHIQMQHLLKATKRELQKMGRLVSEEEFL